MRLKNVSARISLCILAVSLILLALSDNIRIGRALNRTLCAALRRFLSLFSSVFSFSVFEVGVILSPLIVFLLVRYVVGDSGKLKTRLIRVLSILSLLPTLYILTLGIPYRTAVIGGKGDVVESERVFSAAEVIFKNLTDTGEPKVPPTLDEIRTELSESYYEISHAYGLTFYNLPKPKPIALSKIMSSLGIYALYSFPTGEVNINTEIPDYLVPFTVAHEYAHSLGVAGEAEANFLAYLACRASKNSYIRYSGELSMLEYFLADILKSDKEMYTKIYKNLSSQALFDLEQHREYAAKCRTRKLYVISEKMNSLHLEIWDKNGAYAYSSVVEYVTSYLLPE